MPYWYIPDEAYDDPDQMARWVRLAYEAALIAGLAPDEVKELRRLLCRLQSAADQLGGAQE